MTDYGTILAFIAPVFAMMGVGTFARWRGWLKVEAEESMLKVVVNILFPCLVFSSLIGNKAVGSAGNVILPPLVGFLTTGLGFLVGFWVAKLLGLTVGRGLRTFAFTVGVYNYGYIPIPLVQQLFGPETLGVLLVHNVGCDFIIWTIGIILLAGGSWKEAWRKSINAPAIAIVIAIALNAVHADRFAPVPLMQAIKALGLCAVPIGLVVTGSTLFDYLKEPALLMHRRVFVFSVLLRLALLPMAFLVAARYLPLPLELKQVMVVQSAMPAGIGPLIIAKHYGGHPLTAAQIIFGTTAVGIFVIPWWIRFGSAWVGL